jgi:autotransporter translocation and assembly factor TamB
MRRNSWIKGKDSRLELDGDLDVVKNGPNIVLFNELKVIRGQISLLGRRFQIKEEGVLTFRGEDPPNPILNLRAEYEFRTDRTSRELEVIVEGTAEEPTLRFTLDDKEIEFADAISYIIFGASSEDLSSGQQSGVHTVIAMDMASSLASAQLSNSVGEQLNLDYIEVSAKDSWQSATFMVGKYVTNQLFVSYEREFGESRDNDIAAETVTAEWELTRVVSFRLISGNSRERGIDLLFRKEIE